MEFGSTLNSSTSNLTSSMRCDDLSSILKRSKEDNDDLELKDKEITTIDTNLIKDLGKIHLSRSVTGKFDIVVLLMDLIKILIV